VEKLALFCNPTSGTRSQALPLRLWIGIKFAEAKAKVFPHFVTGVRVKDSLSLLMVQYSKDTCVTKKARTIFKQASRPRYRGRLPVLWQVGQTYIGDDTCAPTQEQPDQNCNSQIVVDFSFTLWSLPIISDGKTANYYTSYISKR
jgi:hypothetical protein